MRDERMRSEAVEGFGVVVELALLRLAFDRLEPLHRIWLGDWKIDEEVGVPIGYSIPFVGAMKTHRNLDADSFSGAMAVAEPLADPARDE